VQTFISIPLTQKCHIFGFDTLVANERYVDESWALILIKHIGWGCWERNMELTEGKKQEQNYTMKNVFHPEVLVKQYMD